MTIADLPAPDQLLQQLNASVRAVARHYEICPGCQHGMRCPVYASLRKEEEAILDAACEAMLEKDK